ncbi:MAG: vitamin K epoxide reductase family protein [Chloroflexi bacterium]|uniref:Vitamin K epoxide reductase family protein n=1 Tax=Candidatus Chlorohelix allophototropha TaxID=3003348 RepID=A0A8T7M2Q9_9CHLR|nr:vitamin K epoxide reductase family protein [Chloroflexota bacterium]WJW65761.1 vitamin K epoxide reductase family protein [Chloroflexota bacterium L227-S17]
MATKNKISIGTNTVEEQKNLGYLYDLLVIVLCLAGVGIAGYLSYTRLFAKAIICVEGGGCDTVNNSQYALLLGIPVSFLGFATYIVLAGLAMTRWLMARRNNTSLTYKLDWTLFIISLGSLVFSGYLMSMSFFVIKATCIWCLSSAGIITVLFILLAIRLWRSVEEI